MENALVFAAGMFVGAVIMDIAWAAKLGIVRPVLRMLKRRIFG